MTSTVQLDVGSLLHEFRVCRIEPVPELRAVAYQFEHETTGARLLHIHCADTENLFSVSFPTPPADNTGLPHVLEHAVLSGSEKYPVRDPFFEMVKMSMATFINAMTGWDCTYYPVASNVHQDLFNLAEVYFDAVFHPLLAGETFKREGHHLTPVDSDNPTGDLTVTGIVYNEMKGAFSNPESRLSRMITRALFPDTVYGRESGGDPECIPELTHPGLLQFHRTHYHPSNAYFVLYGDIPPQEFLVFLQPRLKSSVRAPVPAGVPRQPRWTEPRHVEDTYPITVADAAERQGFLMLSWLVGDGTDAAHAVALDILGLILLGNEGAPLRKALIQSGLGADLIYSGYASVGLETIFRVGLKGADPDSCDQFVLFVMDTLQNIARDQITSDRVEAAFQQASYSYREVLPLLPLHVMERILEAWMYDADPLLFLELGRHLDDCRDRYRANPDLFSDLIRGSLLENPHRISVVLRPDPVWQQRTDEQFAERMRSVRAEMTDDELRRIAADAEQLARSAGTPNPPEALAALPQLKVTDLPPQPRHIPTTAEDLGHGVCLLRNDVFANGVNYLHLNFDLRGLPARLWPRLPRYLEALGKLGAAGMNYEQMAHRTAAVTGGIGYGLAFGSHAADPSLRIPNTRGHAGAQNGHHDFIVTGYVVFSGKDLRRVLFAPRIPIAFDVRKTGEWLGSAKPLRPLPIHFACDEAAAAVCVGQSSGVPHVENSRSAEENLYG